MRQATEIHISIDNHQAMIVLPSTISVAKACLLSSRGEEKEQFELHGGTNLIKLNRHHPGAYSLRIESNNEVIVKQIILSA